MLLYYPKPSDGIGFHTPGKHQCGFFYRVENKKKKQKQKRRKPEINLVIIECTIL